jgi:S-disulfanyl-L-cysteine oxidoreductase SoxD
MSMLKVLVLAVVLAVPAAAAETPMLGKPISPADLAPWALSIAPDGSGLPPGKGSVKQGKELFVEKCAGCHGLSGEGQPAERLVGGQGTLTGDQPIRTVGSYWPYATTLFDYIRRAMPLNEPQSLTNDQVYAAAAYILSMNNLIGANATLDAKSLPKVKMPNRANFFTVYPGNLK